MPRVSWSLVLAVWLLPSIAQGSSLLLNGSFEQGPPPFNNQDIDIVAGSTDITGWLVTAGIDLLEDPWDVADGLRAVDLDGRSPGAIQQTFATDVGQTYLVSFQYSGNPSGSLVTKDARVTAGDFSNIFAFDTTGQTITNLTWITASFLFTATDTSSTLAFASLSAADSAYGMVIDNVSVSAVPEPATLALLVTGFAVAGLCRRKFSPVASGPI